MADDTLKLLKSGDYETFEQLVTENQENVYRIVLSVIRDEEEAKDLAQDVFLKIYMSIKSFNGNSSLSTWIYRIAYNTALDHIKKVKNKNKTKSIDDDEDIEVMYLDSKSFNPENEAEKREVSQDIKAALGMLPDEQRQVIELKDVHGFSYDEISAITGLKEGTLKSRLSRGRANLKNILIKKWNI